MTERIRWGSIPRDCRLPSVDESFIFFSPLKVGVWLSLVERFVRDEEVAGSNPVTPTILSCGELIASSSFLFSL
jgi:hypothetical protein